MWAAGSIIASFSVGIRLDLLGRENPRNHSHWPFPYMFFNCLCFFSPICSGIGRIFWHYSDLYFFTMPHKLASLPLLTSLPSCLHFLTHTHQEYIIPPHDYQGLSFEISLTIQNISWYCVVRPQLPFLLLTSIPVHGIWWGSLLHFFSFKIHQLFLWVVGFYLFIYLFCLHDGTCPWHLDVW